MHNETMKKVVIFVSIAVVLIALIISLANKYKCGLPGRVIWWQEDLDCCPGTKPVLINKSETRCVLWFSQESIDQ